MPSLYSICFDSIHVVYLYSSIDTTPSWKKFHFNLLHRSDFQMFNSLSTAVHTFASHILISLSVDEMLLLRYGNQSINFRELPFRVKIPPWLKHVLHFVCIHIEANASSCLHQAMQWGFGLSKCICKKCYVICIVCVHNSFCRILSAL